MKRKRAVITPQMRDDAMILLSKGWTTDRVAKKYKVSTAAVYKWKARHNQGLPTTIKTITNLTKTGDIQPESTLVHNDVVDGREYELIDIKLPGIARTGFNSRFTPEKWCLYLKMINPTTGEIHLEGVARKTDNNWDHIPEETVAGALAWRDGEDPKRGHGFDADKQLSDWKYVEPTVLT